MHLGVLAVTLKVPVRQLEALENDDYGVFRGPAFARAVAQAVCRQLGIDPVPVLAGLPPVKAALSAKPADAAPRSAPRFTTPRSRRAWPVSPKVMGLALLMLLGSAALLWWPTSVSTPVEANAPVLPPTPTASEAAGDEALPVGVNVPSVPADAPASAAPASAPAGKGASATPQAAVPSASPAPATTSVPASSGASAGAEQGLHIEAQGDTWLEVRNSQGQLVVNRLLQQGQSETVTLQPPFNVVLGRAHQARVSWRGQPFDLAPHTRVSSARFDIQP